MCVQQTEYWTVRNSSTSGQINKLKRWNRLIRVENIADRVELRYKIKVKEYTNIRSSGGKLLDNIAASCSPNQFLIIQEHTHTREGGARVIHNSFLSGERIRPLKKQNTQHTHARSHSQTIQPTRLLFSYFVVFIDIYSFFREILKVAWWKFLAGGLVFTDQNLPQKKNVLEYKN